MKITRLFKKISFLCIVIQLILIGIPINSKAFAVLNMPTEVTSGSSRYIYVIDSGSKTIKKFYDTWAEVQSFGGEGLMMVNFLITWNCR